MDIRLGVLLADVKGTLVENRLIRERSAALREESKRARSKAMGMHEASVRTAAGGGLDYRGSPPAGATPTTRRP